MHDDAAIIDGSYGDCSIMSMFPVTTVLQAVLVTSGWRPNGNNNTM